MRNGQQVLSTAPAEHASACAGGATTPAASEDDALSRIRLLMGDAAVERLGAASVLVVGLGAVGSFAVEALARSGVGRLRLADADLVAASNINRQLYATYATLGRPKAILAAERVRLLAPACTVEPIEAFVKADNLASLLSDPPDVVIDAIDIVRDKVSLLRACLSQNVCVVSSMGAARRLDPTDIRIGTLDEISGCPLAKQVKKRLKQAQTDYIHASTPLRCVYSVESPRPIPGPDRQLREARAMGSLVCVTGTFGLAAAGEAMRLILAAP
jgi:tRNA A37 threonylcarbamoyladenosine dehydratase